MTEGRSYSRFLALAIIALRCGYAWADAYDPPPTYYNTATGTGTTLKSQLHNIIKGHTAMSYDAARSSLQITDADPNNPGHMLTVYDRTSLNVAAINPNGPSLFYQTFIRVDAERAYTRVYVTMWDPRQVQLGIVMGTKDIVAPVIIAHRIKAAVPNSHLSFIYGAAHSIEFDAPERVGGLISAFLDRGEAFIVPRAASKPEAA